MADRMPVILGDEVSTDIWLNSSSEATFKTVLKPYDKPDLVRSPCSHLFFVNRRSELVGRLTLILCPRRPGIQ